MEQPASYIAMQLAGRNNRAPQIGKEGERTNDPTNQSQQSRPRIPQPTGASTNFLANQSLLSTLASLLYPSHMVGDRNLPARAGHRTFDRSLSAWAGTVVNRGDKPKPS